MDGNPFEPLIDVVALLGLTSSKDKQPRSPEDRAYALLEEASQMEAKREVAKAMQKYQEVSSSYPGTDAARDAEISVQQLRERIQG